MYSFFYSFYKSCLGLNLFNLQNEDGTSSPPESQERITENGIERITENGIERITE